VIPFLVTAALGAGFVWACVRYAAFMRRLLLRASAATAGLFLWLALGRSNLYVAYAPFALIPVGVFLLWRRRAILGTRRRFEKAMRAEAGEADRKSTPKILSVEKIEDD